MFNNVKSFSELAIYYDKHGYYPYTKEYKEVFMELNRNKKAKDPVTWPTLDDMSYSAQEFALYWIRVFVNGYRSGGVPITGEHMFYLNCCRIIKVKQGRKEGQGSRVPGFPDFWDEDFRYYHTCDIAKYGISLEDFDKLNRLYDLNVVRTEENLKGGKNHLWGKPRGVGAPQPINEIVITPSGEKRIGEISVGDLVFDRFGNPTKVIGVYPQGKLRVYEVTLLDGRKVTCGENHLWTVETRIRYGKEEYKDLTTKQLIDNGLTKNLTNGQKAYKYKIPKLSPVKFEEKSLPIPPYVLGALLGDGSMSGKNIKIATDDIEIIDKIINDLYDWEFEAVKDKSNNNYILSPVNSHNYEDKIKYKVNTKGKFNRLKKEIELLGLNVSCKEKYIPDIYKYGSITQRVELVKGLMDTDGSITKEGYCEFTNTSEKLVDDLAYVLRSLGIYCSKGISDRSREQTITDRTGRSCTFTESKYYRLYISTNKNIFHISRKANRINRRKNTRSSTPIVAIKALDIWEEQVCLGVDNSEHLYLTRDFIVTHNSWKGAEFCNYNLHLKPDSETFVFAETDQYIGFKDGFFAKFSKLMNFIQKEIWFLRKDFLNRSATEYLYRTGTKDVTGNETGFLSTVSGVVIDGDPEKGRGKRGDIIFEEFGSFPSVEKTWLVAHASTNEYGINYGQQRGFGTGGDDEGNATVDGLNALNKMMYDPRAYNILEFYNKEEETSGTATTSMFTPAYINITDKDENGNSLKEKGIKVQTKWREEWKKAQDPTVYTNKCAEYPWKISEMFNLAGYNIFPVRELQEHLNQIKLTNIDSSLVTNGWIDENLKFYPTEDRPYIAYPPTKEGSKKGAISLFQPPYKVGGKIPDGLYRICVDSYDQNESEGYSIGSVYVFESENPFTPWKGDLLAAWYNARPEGHDGLDTFAKNLFLLAEYYNAKVGLENDRATSIISYAKTHTDTKGRRLTLYLEDQFELAHDERLRTKMGMVRPFGMHMTETRKQMADKYIQEWLLTPRGTDIDGRRILNLHLIYDVGLLNELILFKGKNADRISALRIGMYHKKEYEYKAFRKARVQSYVDPFFELELFQ